MPDGRRLLIVEDDVDLAENLAEILESAGYQPVVAHSAEEALDALDTESIDGVITDFRLPGLGGVDLITQLRDRGLPVPVVMISAFMDRRVAEQAEAAGALEVLHKPVNLDRLFQLVQMFCEPRGEVLIVEDNTELAENVAEALAGKGMETAIGSSAESALGRRTLPRVALVDLRLPDQDGIEVARRLRARDPSIEIIFVTGFGDELKERLAGAGLGLPGAARQPTLLTKPIDLQELVEHVRAAVSEPK